uniref:hypothetical protein n=1 Tax=Roseovarius sp. BRH_c41 TaxID=1629709 RepID=UPI000ACB5EB4|nr:hypothetical protein [Roseovarius sp. BRH_c41]
MKIRVIQDAHHRISSGLSQSFKAGTEVSVPQATAEVLVARGVAEVIGGKKPSNAKE